MLLEHESFSRASALEREARRTRVGSALRLKQFTTFRRLYHQKYRFELSGKSI